MEPLHVLFTAAQRKVLADLLPEFTDRLKLDQKNPRTISFTTKELESIRDKANAARHHAENGMKRNSLQHVVNAVTKALEESEGIRSIPASERLYQFKITLNESQPPIGGGFRSRNARSTGFTSTSRLQWVGRTAIFTSLIEIDGKRYGDPELIDDGFEDFECVDPTITKISEIVPKCGKRFSFLYEYDFGDGWEHEVVFEGCLKAESGGRYPLYVD